jgi:predicted nucleotidyltransferase
MTPSVPPDIEATLQAYARLLRERFAERLRDLRLFGSRARGDADADSDVDVMVVVHELTDGERAGAIDLGVRSVAPGRPARTAARTARLER